MNRREETTTSRVTLYDEAMFARLRNLVLQSQQLARTGLAGEHQSRRRGLSPEFSDFKAYSPGDDFRLIDWKTYARFDELFVRESETTIEYDIHILVDTSQSMNWSSDDTHPTKLRHALRIAGAIAWISLWHFDRVTLGTLDHVERKRRPLGPLQGRSQIMPVFRYFEEMPVGVTTNLASAALRYVHARSRPGMLILLSDALDDDAEALEQTFQRLAARGWETCLLRIEDPAEVDPTLLIRPDANLELVDVESASTNRMQVQGGTRTIDAYLAQRNAWSSELDVLNRQARARVMVVRTDEEVETTVFSRLRVMGMVR